MADRYAYQPFIGLFIMVCWGVAESAKDHFPRVVLPAVSVALLGILGVLTSRQIGYWKDDLALWSRTLQVTGSSFVVEYHIGIALQDQGQPAEAAQHFFQAERLNPEDPAINMALPYTNTRVET